MSHLAVRLAVCHYLARCVSLSLLLSVLLSVSLSCCVFIHKLFNRLASSDITARFLYLKNQNTLLFHEAFGE